MWPHPIGRASHANYPRGAGSPAPGDKVVTQNPTLADVGNLKLINEKMCLVFKLSQEGCQTRLINLMCSQLQTVSTSGHTQITTTYMIII